MASQSSSKARVGRKLTKKRRDPGRISMDLPERFQVDDDHDEEENAAGDNPPLMHQSVFGMLAAAQSKTDFHSRFQEDSGSESEGDQHSGRVSQEASRSSSQDTSRKTSQDTGKRLQQDTSKKASVEHPDLGARHKKRLSEHKLIRSLPRLGLKPIKERRESKSNDDHMTTSQFLPPRPEPPQLPQVSAKQDVRSDAPVMDQMLQARAKAELESSRTSLDGRRSRDDSSSESSKRPKPPTKLPEALADIFMFDKPEEVISEYPCWYLQSVLLQGYMYITQKHVCFYAYLQKRSNVVVKSGHLAKRGKQNPRYHRYWFILKGDVLSYYTNAAEPYFPSGNIDLRYGISADLVQDKDRKDATAFTITTDKRTYYFRADSAPSAKEWVKQLQKIMFRSRNDGDSVKISIPIENIVDVEKNPVIGFAETVKIRAIDNDETYAVDEYFFTFFSFGKDALHVLSVLTENNSAKEALDHTDRAPEGAATTSAYGRSISRERSPRLSQSPAPLIHESVRATLAPPAVGGRSSPRISGEFTRSSMDGTRSRSSFDHSRTSFDRGRRSVSAASRVSFSGARRGDRSPLSPSAQESSESFVTSSEQAPSSPVGADMSASQMLKGDGAFDSPTLKMPQPRRTASGNSVERLRRESMDTARSNSQDRIRLQPPSRTQTALHHTSSEPLTHEQTQKLQGTDSTALGGLMRAGVYPFQHASGLAGYMKSSGSRIKTLLGGTPMGYYEKVSGALAGGKRHYSEADGLAAEDHVGDPEDDLDTMEHERRFQEHFGLPDSEALKATFYGSLHRVLPLYGKIYIGSRSFCFRSLIPGTRTKVVIPFRDIDNVGKEKGFRLRWYGMVMVIRGHEEVFFEFRSAGLRDDCTITVLQALDTLKYAQNSTILSMEEKEDAENAAAENQLLQTARQDGYADHDLQLPQNVDLSEPGAPPIIFDDPGASMLDFKPREPLRITCLTIGSRGDVQPYIALCKGLLTEGHKPRIATHAEFEPWVRRHGIDFAPVKGDPAELMRICVENGMFTPSFLYEANTKFRGFVDTLLSSSWDACQETDLLIESPSAMAGIHIAEALGIPYFRAFTMPWTRTRAYPHAFAVPNHKMGGAYNYMTYVMFDNIFWQSTAGQVNRWRVKSLGLRPTTLDKLQPNKVPFLYNFSPSVVVPPLDFSDWIRVTGYWFLDEATDWTPPKDLLAFINKARQEKQKLVYIGFGSVVVSDSKQMTQNIIDAVVKADVRCILAKGWSDRLDKKDATVPEVPLPASIFQIEKAPHDWLFKQIDAAVHHGGAGTTGASLRAGVPTIIKPFFGDQFFFGTRVEDLGVGIHINRVTKNALGRALWIATHDERMRRKAKILGEQIRRENGVETAIKAIYRDMEYAKSLIKKRVADIHVADDDEAETEESWTFVENDSDQDSGPAPGGATGWARVGSTDSRGRQTSLGSMVLRKR